MKRLTCPNVDRWLTTEPDDSNEIPDACGRACEGCETCAPEDDQFDDHTMTALGSLLARANDC